VNTPKELKYTGDHEWVRLEGSRAVVGITDFAQSQLGDVVFVEVPEPGTAVTAGSGFSVVESVKAVSDIYAPLSGTVVEVNEALSDTPEAVNQDPYGAGWIAVIEITDRSELDQLLDSTEYEKLAAEEAHD
jgi:glycine cleavage system H protein